MESNIRKTKKLMVEVLHAMTDAELDAIIGPNPPDLSEFSDQELQSIINDTASPALLARVDAATTHPTTKAAP